MWPPHSLLDPQSLATGLLLLLTSSSYVNGAIVRTQIDDAEPRFSFPSTWNTTWNTIPPFRSGFSSSLASNQEKSYVSGPSGTSASGSQSTAIGSPNTTTGGAQTTTSSSSGASTPHFPAGDASQSKPKIGIITGAVLGVLAVLAIVIFSMCRRRKNEATDGAVMNNSPLARPRRIRGNYVIQPFVVTLPDADREAQTRFVNRSAPEKRLDVEWNNASHGQREQPRADSADPPSASAHPGIADMGPTARERMVEARLAQLEAQAVAAPPPYIPA